MSISKGDPQGKTSGIIDPQTGLPIEPDPALQRRDTLETLLEPYCQDSELICDPEGEYGKEFREQEKLDQAAAASKQTPNRAISPDGLESKGTEIIVPPISF
ncbi:MAG: hypothetical protein R3F23_00975 [Verrucomicrobiia bacterium]